MPFNVGMTELIVVLVVAVVLFGGRLPEVARNLGASYQQFRKGLNEIQSSIKKDLDADPINRSPRNLTHRDYVDDYDAAPSSAFTPPPAEDEKTNG